ncbi:hypothetical protein RDWZM_009400 [Blomia tropicalis]|uniref:Serine/threonine-protein kinase RIO1 n=1 Tax=Blomia tropicalis TaxID=40697 RepID=A0A9Q0RJP5_BLOTA|nr:Serine/threonine-protein kinase RIO1 [Blomia tropicalis]KAJ6218243.1 hypothetical protein RDWZM_009400 [Blomia tropicalis]
MNATQFLDAIEPGEEESLEHRLERQQLNDYSDEDDQNFDDDNEDDELLFDNGLNKLTSVNGAKHEHIHQSNFQPSLKKFSKYEEKINLDAYNVPNKTWNILHETDKRIYEERKRIKDKCDRATVEQVLDPRTRMILFKLINRRYIEQINGCISTGKEANVYHATSNDGVDKAVKIYKTSILIFKDRDKYVSGEFRFRHGYCRHNPRKMVRTWAEKEMRNLCRIYQVGINCPKPQVLRSHILVMDFVGKDGIPAPLLKDVNLSDSKFKQLYLECIIIMRRLFNDCHLVHADLSEFNLLYHDSSIYVIDVSQSVEHDHPFALDFLRKDCVNINDFFTKKNVLTMTTKELFDFVTDPNINDKNMDQYLEKSQELAENRAKDGGPKPTEVLDEEVFKQVFIAQRLEQIAHYDKQTNKDQTHYKTIAGMKSDLMGPSMKPALLDNQEESDESGESDSDTEESIDDNSKFQNSARPKNETIEEKKQRKQALKLEQREKRKTKIPKHVKKRKERLGKNQKK